MALGALEGWVEHADENQVLVGAPAQTVLVMIVEENLHMMPPLGALRVFEVAARLESFSRAADELHVTHAAVSHQIRQLEEWFGRPLFLREKRGVQLAPDAERLAEALSASFERIAAEADSLKLRTKSEITVACIPSIATRWLIPALGEFSQPMPTSRLRWSMPSPRSVCARPAATC